MMRSLALVFLMCLSIQVAAQDTITIDYSDGFTGLARNGTNPIIVSSLDGQSLVQRARCVYPDYRSECRLDSSWNPARHLTYHSDYTLSFRLWPKRISTVRNRGTTVFQLHGHADSGESGKSPVLAIKLSIVDGAMLAQIRSNAQPDKISSTCARQERYNVELPNILNRWSQWEIHYTPSWQSDGKLSVSCDGDELVSQDGMNCYNDDNGPWMAWGIYQPDFKTTTPETTVRVVYHDDVVQKLTTPSPPPIPQEVIDAVNALATQATALQADATQLRTEAAQLKSQAVQLDSQADALERKAAELRQAADELKQLVNQRTAAIIFESGGKVTTLDGSVLLNSSMVTFGSDGKVTIDE